MTFAERVRARELVVGTFISSASAPVAEAAASGGIDFLVVDLEHGVPDRAGAIAIVRTLSTRLALLVRTPPGDAHAGELALDAGATGLVLPRIDTADELDAAFARTSYAHGRGLARAVPAWRWGADAGDAFAADAAILRIAQVETLAALDTAAEIAAHPLVDALFLGAVDLALDARRLGRDVSDGAALVAKAAAAAGKPCAALIPSWEEIPAWYERGYTVLAVSADVRMVAEACARIAATAAEL